MDAMGSPSDWEHTSDDWPYGYVNCITPDCPELVPPPYAFGNHPNNGYIQQYQNSQHVMEQALAVPWLRLENSTVGLPRLDTPNRRQAVLNG
ncbi:hypothetical protein WOLCODRAFT_148494 [Wolfiporia cocos MD-104 SS10]|uniref:Uncharacterized protein n=1 Tax=Wolfiporia cocos (strain MD-104) TaxID=742152 RepID=A0A2H3IWR9_WOLCO|nr:hypothetical protein WOLCODRAFT_148494 [Wolfiporia cocos MD-104 SS10]